MKLLPAIARAILIGVFATVTEADADDTNKIRTIVTRGERVDLDGFLVKGKYTLFEFYADWSSACEKWMPRMEAKIEAGDDVVLRRINVRSWSSPVVSQHRITAVPHYKLYDASGRLIREFSPEGAETAAPSDGRRASSGTVGSPATGSSSSSSSSRSSGSSSSPGSPGPPKVDAPKVLNISPRGERVDLEKHVVRGQYTLFEFYADW